MARLTDVNVEFVSLVDRAAQRDPSHPTEPQRLLLWKAERSENNDEGGNTMADTLTVDDLRAELTKAQEDLAAANAERDQAVARATELENAKAEEDPEPKPLDKADLEPAVRALVEKAEANAKANAEKAESAELIAKQERDLRITKEFVSLAKSDYTNVAGDVDKFGPVLKRASELLPADDYALLTTQLKAAEARVQAGALFGERGYGDRPVPEAQKPHEAITAKAEELQKADPSLSRYEAMERARRMGGRESQDQYLSVVR